MTIHFTRGSLIGCILKIWKTNPVSKINQNFDDSKARFTPPHSLIEYLSFLRLSKSKIMREREEQKQREEEAALSEVSTTQQDVVPTWQPPTDEVLQGYIEEVRSNIQPLATTSQQVEALAR